MRRLIWLVSDTPVVCERIAGALQESGYEVTSCTTGAEMLSLLLVPDARCPDLIVLSTHSSLRALRLALALKEHPALARVPLLIWSHPPAIIDQLFAARSVMGLFSPTAESSQRVQGPT
jgi:DNA-binding response OmpR family regulator